ncbi:hypothetical protein DVP60_10805 [Yersinia enterocolitica]|uniref:hypothetical protein n=1 Tax=Yersinia enterocolitica TaxID=630 RepID=UPI0003152BE4|nr:hypothetical protein [Yersinia enterocolitica]EKN3945959.1 hypothetical protein [Yersinia enterocolitica]EKN6316729.1 hypothetical protein [Yersinia enterocolitica]
MSDIYHHTIISPQRLAEMPDGELSSLTNSSESAFYAITKGLTSVGNFISSAVDSESYEDNEAKNDLRNIAAMLRVLPRLAEAFIENSDNADYIIASRNTGEATK